MKQRFEYVQAAGNQIGMLAAEGYRVLEVSCGAGVLMERPVEPIEPVLGSDGPLCPPVEDYEYQVTVFYTRSQFERLAMVAGMKGETMAGLTRRAVQHVVDMNP